MDSIRSLFVTRDFVRELSRLRRPFAVSAALITEAGTDRPQGWRLAAREIEDAPLEARCSSPAHRRNARALSGAHARSRRFPTPRNR